MPASGESAASVQNGVPTSSVAPAAATAAATISSVGRRSRTGRAARRRIRTSEPARRAVAQLALDPRLASRRAGCAARRSARSAPDSVEYSCPPSISDACNDDGSERADASPAWSRCVERVELESTGPIFAIASTPRSGREPCAATPRVSISKPRSRDGRPRLQLGRLARHRRVRTARARRAPRCRRSPTSSSATAVDDHVSGEPERAASAAASMSGRQPALHVVGAAAVQAAAAQLAAANGSSMPATPTVSRCAFSSSQRPPPRPRRRRTRTADPATGSTTSTSRPARSSQPATKPRSPSRRHRPALAPG